MYIAHCTLHIAHCTLHIAHCTRIELDWIRFFRQRENAIMLQVGLALTFNCSELSKVKCWQECNKAPFSPKHAQIQSDTKQLRRVSTALRLMWSSLPTLLCSYSSRSESCSDTDCMRLFFFWLFVFFCLKASSSGIDPGQFECTWPGFNSQAFLHSIHLWRVKYSYATEEWIDGR